MIIEDKVIGIMLILVGGLSIYIVLKYPPNKDSSDLTKIVLNGLFGGIVCIILGVGILVGSMSLFNN